MANVTLQGVPPGLPGGSGGPMAPWVAPGVTLGWKGGSSRPRTDLRPGERFETSRNILGTQGRYGETYGNRNGSRTSSQNRRQIIIGNDHEIRGETNEKDDAFGDLGNISQLLLGRSKIRMNTYGVMGASGCHHKIHEGFLKLFKSRIDGFEFHKVWSWSGKSLLGYSECLPDSTTKYMMDSSEDSYRRFSIS